MPVSIKLIHRAALSIAMAFGIAQPALASPAECTCLELASLQQDYRNVETLELYFESLADHLKAFELRKAKDIPDDPSGRYLLRDLSLGEEQVYRSKYPPGDLLEPVEGYFGPADVKMDSGTCEQPPDDLEKMDARSPCRAIADAALNHEAFHRAECTRMGPDVYWRLMPSEYALEEVVAYSRQAKELRDELRRVLDESTITYKADWTFDLNIGGMAQYAYAYTGESDDIGNATAGDIWTMSGKGTSKVAWIKAVFMGKQCTPSGAVNSTYDLKMTTDGLTFGLELTGQSSSGGLSVKCPGPGGGGGQVADGGGEGVFAENLPLNQGINSLPGDMGETMRDILAGMGTVGGGGKRILSVTCDGP